MLLDIGALQRCCIGLGGRSTRSVSLVSGAERGLRFHNDSRNVRVFGCMKVRASGCGRSDPNHVMGL